MQPNPGNTSSPSPAGQSPALVCGDLFGELEYLAASPAPEHGGFHPRITATASAALVEIKKLRALLQHMLDVAENADETGYVTDAGFVDIDELHAEVREALSPNAPLSEPLASSRKPEFLAKS